MDKKSQVLIIVFALILTASTVASFYRYIILEKITYATDEETFNQSLLENQEAE